MTRARFRTGRRASASRCGPRCSAFLEYEIFENTTQVAAPYAAGSWPAILTAPYTFVNQSLFSYYGSSTFASGTSVDGHDAHEGRPEHLAAPRSADPGRNGGGLDDQQQHEPGAARQLHHQQADVPQHRAAGGVHADAARSLQRQDRARALSRSTPRRPSARNATSTSIRSASRSRTTTPSVSIARPSGGPTRRRTRPTTRRSTRAARCPA